MEGEGQLGGRENKDRVAFKINPNGRNIALRIRIIREPQQQTGLADARVPDKEQLEKVIVSAGRRALAANPQKKKKRERLLCMYLGEGSYFIAGRLGYAPRALKSTRNTLCKQYVSMVQLNSAQLSSELCERRVSGWVGSHYSGFMAAEK